jgi:molecular chaperone GrpE
MSNEDALPEQDSPQPAPADASDWVPEDESPDAPAPGDDVAADLETLVTLVAERDKYLDQLQRTTADFDNYRKRVQREMSEARDAGAASLAGKLVDVLDTVDLALAHDPSDAVAQVAGALFDALGKEGLERIDALGAPFDPEVHDAVVHEEGDGPAEVIEVLRNGWKWNGRVVRPAMVKTKGS